MPPTNPYQNPYQNNPIVYSSNTNLKPGLLKRKSIKIGIFLTFLLIIIIVVIVVLKQGKTPNAAANQFLDKIMAGQTNQSYQLTNSNFRTSTALSTWQTDVKSIDNECSGKITMISKTQKTLTAQDQFSIQSTGAEKCQVIINLAKNSNKWWIDSLNVGT